MNHRLQNKLLIVIISSAITLSALYYGSSKETGDINQDRAIIQYSTAVLTMQSGYFELLEQENNTSPKVLKANDDDTLKIESSPMPAETPLPKPGKIKTAPPPSESAPESPAPSPVPSPKHIAPDDTAPAQSPHTTLAPTPTSTQSLSPNTSPNTETAPSPVPTPTANPTTTPTATEAPSQTSHIFYTSSHWKAKYYYCDTDKGWEDLSEKYLKSFDSEEELLKNYDRVLHKPCKEN